MPGRLEPLGRREQRPGVTSVQATSPARPAGQGPAIGRVSQLARPGRAGCDPQQEIFLARQVRARCLVAGLRPGQIAEKIHDECGPAAGTSWIRAYRLARGISLADVVAQVRAWYVSEGRTVPRFSETLLSAYESGQKRPGPEYLHYLCAVYRADPPDLGYPDPCFCGRGHGEERPARAPAGPGAAAPGGPAGIPSATPGYPAAGPDPGGRGPVAAVKLAPQLAATSPAATSLAAVSLAAGWSASARPRPLSWPMPVPKTMTTWSAGCCCG